MTSQLRALIVKEFFAVWRHKPTRAILILPPIIQLFLFSFAATLEVKRIDIAIYNQDNGKQSSELIQRIVHSPKFRQAYYVHNQKDLSTLMHEQKVLVALHFPPNFSKTIQQKKPGKLQVILDGRRSNAASIVQGYISDISEQYGFELAKDLKSPLPNAQIKQRNWFNPNLEFTWYTIPCLVGILSMVISLVLTALSVAREREMGTFEQLLVSPLTANEILIGKTIPALFIALAEGSFILTLAITLFGIEFQGNIFLLFGSMIFFLMAVLGIGLFISSLCVTQQQAVLGAFLFMVPGVIISGFATPAENMPIWLQYLSELMPLKHFLIVIKGVFLKDMGAHDVFSHTWPNFLIALITLPMAAFMFKRIQV